MTITLKTLIKNNFANFVCYRDGDLWYRIEVTDEPSISNTPEATAEVSEETRVSITSEVADSSVFDFPVPVGDTGTGVFNSRVKAVTLMRWVRKHFERIESGEWS